MYIYIVPLRQAYSEDLMIAHGSVAHATNGTCYVSWLLTTASSACVVGGECCKGARIDEGAGGLATLQYKTPDPHLALQQLPRPCLIAWKTSLKHTRSRLIVSHNHSPCGHGAARENENEEQNGRKTWKRRRTFHLIPRKNQHPLVRETHAARDRRCLTFWQRIYI